MPKAIGSGILKKVGVHRLLANVPLIFIPGQVYDSTNLIPMGVSESIMIDSIILGGNAGFVTISGLVAKLTSIGVIVPGL
jgi:hypothetical protein